MPLKTCPSCASKVGPRKTQCDCGHFFQKKSPSSSPINEEVASHHNDYSYRFIGTIYTPAGEPPKKPSSFSEENIINWALDMRELASPKFFTVEGLLYWTHHYFCNKNDNREEFDRIAGILRRMDEGDKSP